MDDAKAKELLARERARIERALEDLKPLQGDEQSNLDQHMADDATELYQDERDQGLSHKLREELAAIERAEQRLADGKYGVSIQSGDPIPDGRLELVPWAERTVEEEGRP